jgi:hypothetical protein
VLRVVLLLGVLLVAVGCGEDEVSVDEVAVVRGSSPGVLTEVSDSRLTLAPENGGEEQTFAIRQVERAQLDLFHLEEHVREEWPVNVLWEDVDGTRYAVRVDDA